MQTIWNKNTETENKPRCKEDQSCDVLIVGAGIAGLLCAFRLQQQGYRVIVVERQKMNENITSKSTAKITIQMGLFYSELIDNLGIKNAKLITDLYQEAINEYERIIHANKIECSFKRLDSCLYSKSNCDLLRREYEAARILGIECSFDKSAQTPDGQSAVLTFYNQAQFNPLQFTYALSKELSVYENTKILSIDEEEAVTEYGIIRFKQVVFATHYPEINVPGFYFMKMHQERSHILVLDNVPIENRILYGIDNDGCSFRWEQNLLLFGGENYRTGSNHTKEKMFSLRSKARRLFPQAKELMSWSTQDCITLDHLPYIGPYSRIKKNWFVVTGFNKWGMINAMAGALIIPGWIKGEKRRIHELFDSRRSVFASLTQWTKEGIEAIGGLLKEAFYIPECEAKDLPIGHGGVVWLSHKKWGIYRESETYFHLVNVRCPHMGCQLEWNPEEKSWDCPCHGSRFDWKGEVLDGPSLQNLDYHQIKL